jgi:hypothetical protein
MIWLMAALMAGFTAPAKASILDLTLEPTQFYSDSALTIPVGGLLSGSFTLDTGSLTVSDISITTTATPIIDLGFTFDMGLVSAPLLGFFNADSLDSNGNIAPGQSAIVMILSGTNPAGSPIGLAEQVYCTTSDPTCSSEIIQYAGITLDVPEPASLAILGFGLAGLAAVRRRHS